MAQPTAEMENAARRAADQVYIELVAMLLANQTGEVAVVVGFNRLMPQARPVKDGTAIKLERGRWAMIEVAE